jgi:hypothetical protein
METRSVTIIVRTGAGDLFERLQASRSDLPLRVMWDRCRGDRRVTSDPSVVGTRQGERRREPPYTWDAADFIVLQGSLIPEPAVS